ncbi:Preprotein translocase subunit SecA [Candidatus Hepatincolaceae symbiont of Richtersius coronifer]
MLNFLLGIFKNRDNEKIIKRFLPTIEKINAFETPFEKLSDEELKNKTASFKAHLAQGKTLDQILPEAFATVREAAKRVLKQRHFDVQLMGGIALHNAMISEMLTGEGKTLVSTLPAYLNALLGKGVHIITVNDYLAQRDSRWMGQIFNFLGLSVGVILSSSSEEDRKIAYSSDITYGTNNEFGFDYLRDNMKTNINALIQRPFYYAIIDEIDSILIDEARTPLIISGSSDDRTELYKVANGFVKYFDQKEDFAIDEKQKSINITEKGLEKLEGILNKSGLIIKGSLFDSHNIQLYHFIVQALRAHHLFKKEVDYIIKDGEAIIIDEFTGRIMDGRRFSEGLHQALEAKEGLKVKEENQTLASITFQNYFKMYPKLGGMTGTALTEAQEFIEIYNLKVVNIPSHRKVLRKDFNDEIYLTYKEKEKAIILKVKDCYEKQQPVLIGTVSIEKSESLSMALKAAKLPHKVLNAKYHETEAYIISQAGKPGAITIATNMAGRGTDIQLGGNMEMLLAKEDYSKLDESEKEKRIFEIKEHVQRDKKIAMETGGLFVIGTERHESRRIDNQLRGRAGRQGEPGASRFYISLEDDLMRVFGSNKLESTLKRLGFKEDEAISHPMISKAIEKAQKRVEQYNFETRKSLLKFDNVINEQRKVIYGQRKQIMNQEINTLNLVKDNMAEIAEQIVQAHLPEKEYREKWAFTTLRADLARIFNNHDLDVEKLAIEEAKELDEIIELIVIQAQKKIDEKIAQVSLDNFETALRSIVLQMLDYSWKKHLLELDHVRGAINLRAYANKDPFNEYQKESFILFSGMLEEFKERIVSIATHIEFTVEPNPEKNLSNTSNLITAPIIENKNIGKVGRNDPCPCNSGKKYKNCHGK